VHFTIDPHTIHVMLRTERSRVAILASSASTERVTDAFCECTTNTANTTQRVDICRTDCGDRAEVFDECALRRRTYTFDVVERAVQRSLAAPLAM
jgi:hypothetical protein